MAEFVVKAKDISVTPKRYEWPLSEDWIEKVLLNTGLSPKGHGEVWLDAYLAGSDVAVKGQARLAASGECGRCLGPLVLNLSPEIYCVYSLRAPGCRTSKNGLDLTPEEIDREFFDGETVELDATLREHLLLEIPMHVVCKDDCEGLLHRVSSAHAVDHEKMKAAFPESRIDPRWQALEGLLERSTSTVSDNLDESKTRKKES